MCNGGTKVMEKVESFYKEYEDLFEEYLDNVRRNLRNNNEKYIELQKEYHKILDENENLIWVLEGDIKDRTLSNDECFALSKLVKIHYDIHSIEEKERLLIESIYTVNHLRHSKRREYLGELSMDVRD